MAVVRRSDAEPGAPIRLEGVCPVEDAESLASLILEDPNAVVDWTACTRMHTAQGHSGRQGFGDRIPNLSLRAASLRSALERVVSTE